MTEPVVSVMMDELVTVVRDALPELGDRVTYGAPEMQPFALSVWFDYRVLDIEVGLLDVVNHQAVATIAVPRQGNYPLEYRTVTDMAQLVRQAIRTRPFYADEATLVAIEQEAAFGSGWAGEADKLVAARVIATLETKSEIIPLVFV